MVNTLLHFDPCLHTQNNSLQEGTPSPRLNGHAVLLLFHFPAEASQDSRIGAKGDSGAYGNNVMMQQEDAQEEGRW